MPKYSGYSGNREGVPFIQKLIDLPIVNLSFGNPRFIENMVDFQSAMFLKNMVYSTEFSSNPSLLHLPSRGWDPTSAESLGEILDHGIFWPPE